MLLPQGVYLFVCFFLCNLVLLSVTLPYYLELSDLSGIPWSQEQKVEGGRKYSLPSYTQTNRTQLGKT